MLKQIPNLITLTNAFMGCLCLICIFTDQMDWLPYFLAVGLAADFGDGLAARLLKASSPLGKELDSLADMISFGAVPGAMFYYLINQSQEISQPVFGEWGTLWGLAGFIITVFAAYRLAKFNIDTRQNESFVGLNTPATTIFSFGLLLIAQNNTYGLNAYLLQLPTLLVLVGILSFLLVAEIPLFSFKFKSFGWAGNEVRFIFILMAIGLLILLPIGLALVSAISLYLISSLVLWTTGNLKL
jgi:CDP-diacylglycerol--serine O-phosphatidyltransferase